MKLSHVVSTVALVAGFAGLSAGAEQIKTDSGTDLLSSLVKPFDVDNDGRLDSQEVNAITDAKFKQQLQTLDSDKDGVISATELRAGRDQVYSRFVSLYDTNHDGALDKQELSAITERKIGDVFKKVDTNQDGKVDATELSRARSGTPKEGNNTGTPGTAPGSDMNSGSGSGMEKDKGESKY